MSFELEQISAIGKINAEVADTLADLSNLSNAKLLTLLQELAASSARNHTVKDERIQQLEQRIAKLKKEARIQARMLRVDEILLDTINGAGGLAQLKTTVSEALGYEVYLVDLTLKHTLHDRAAELAEAEHRLIALAGKQDNVVRGTGTKGQKLTVVGAKRAQDLLGAVITEHKVSAADEAVLLRCARLLAAFVLSQRRLRGDARLRKQELLEQVLYPPPGGANPSVLRRLADYAIVQDEPFRLLLARGADRAIQQMQHRLEFEFDAQLLHAIIDGELIALVSQKAYRAIVDIYGTADSKKHGDLLIGHSPRLHRIEIVPPELSLVRRVVRAAGTNTDKRGALVSLESYGAIGAFLSSVNLEPTRMAVKETLRPLSDYDTEHGTELVETAYVYLDHARQISTVAQVLHVHENTVRKRLDRIAALLGDNWDYGQAGLDHHIMLAANRLLG